MRYVKMLGLMAVAAIAITALAATASATELTSSGSKVYTGKIEAQSEGGGVTLHGPASITCNSGGSGSVEKHGSSIPVSGPVESWAFTNCPNSMHAIIKKAGRLEVHPYEPAGDGTVTSTGAEVEVKDTNTGINCIYTTNETFLGVLTGNKEGKATLHVDTQKVPRTGGSIFCGSSGELTGSYWVTGPEPLWVK